MTWLGHGQDEERGGNSVRAKLMQELPGSPPDQAESRSGVTSAVNFRNKTGDTSAVGNYKVQITLPSWHHEYSETFHSRTI